MRLSSPLIAGVVAALGGCALSLAISVVGLFAYGVPDTFKGVDDFQLLLAQDRAAAVSYRHAPYGDSLSDEELETLRMKYSLGSAFFEAWVLEFESGEATPPTTRFVSALGFPRPALVLEAPWPAERLFRDILSLPQVAGRGAQVQSRMGVQVLWEGVLVGATLFGLPVWCLWIARIKEASPRLRFISVALTGAMLLTVLSAWSAGLAKTFERRESFSDAIAYVAAVRPIEVPPAGDWNVFNGRRARGWTHTRESWSFGRRSADGVSVTPVRWWNYEGCGFPFISFINESSTDARGLGFCCLCAPASPFDVCRMKPAWPGFMGSLLFWLVVMAASVKLPKVIQRAVRARRGDCRGCGHPLAGLPCCPECGAVVK
jgi:hypothetical protein